MERQTKFLSLFFLVINFCPVLQASKVQTNLRTSIEATTNTNTITDLTDLRDGKTYETVQIGTQIWMAENFAYLPEVGTKDVSVYGYAGNSLEEAKATLSYKEFGALYSWEFAKEFAPPGWRLPTDADWQQLEKEIGISPELANSKGWRGEHNEADILKEQGDSGFAVKFGGWRTDYGEFKFQGQHANFWVADEHDLERAHERLIGLTNGKIGREYGNKGCGFSVRYVRDIPAEDYISYPTGVWEKLENPQSFGWNKEKLEDLYSFIRDSTNATGVVVIQSGKKLFEYGDNEEVTYIASVRKSLLSMLYGKYVKEGTIDLGKNLKDLGIDDIEGLLPQEKKATTLDILMSKSGVYHPAGNEGGNEWLFPERGSKEPGSHFIYNNWDFNIAGEIFQRETGKDLYDAFERDIVYKTGFEDWEKDKQFWYGDTTKSKYKAYHFMLSTRDKARIGYLMLRKGKWKNEQVIPEEWVDQITTITTSYDEMYQVDPRLKNWPWWNWGQGLMWRIWDSPGIKPELVGAYTATGNMGQYITVIPTMDLVIALKTKSHYGRRTEKDIYNKIVDKFIEAKK